MIHSLTIQRTTTYSVKLEAETREEAESIARSRVIDGQLDADAEDWEFIHSTRTRHFVPDERWSSLKK